MEKSLFASTITLSSNERFYRTFHYLPVDHPVDMEFGYWDEVHTLWEKEGLPSGLDTHEKLELYFGLERRWRPPVNVLIQPDFEREEIEVKDGWLYFYDLDHVLCRVPENGLTTMPEHLEYPLKSRSDWEQFFKPRLQHDTPGRYPDDLSKRVDFALEKNYMPWLYVGSLFGRLRNFTGFERICYMIYDEPDLVDEIIQHLADLTCEILELTLPAMKDKVLIGHFWEDICYRSGPMISPHYFRDHVVPRYRQITDVLHRFGIEHVIVDCDGWIGPLIDSWLDTGIDIMFPLERASGTDPVMLRREYGERLRLLGGIDKRAIAAGGDTIIRELEYLAPLVEQGGYIPHCDHLCPADVSFKNYRFYLQKKREIFGIPPKTESVRRYPSD